MMQEEIPGAYADPEATGLGWPLHLALEGLLGKLTPLRRGGRRRYDPAVQWY
jgi:hypothetical protein